MDKQVIVNAGRRKPTGDKGVALIFVTVTMMLVMIFALGMLVSSSTSYESSVDTTITQEGVYLSKALALDISEKISKSDSTTANNEDNLYSNYLSQKANDFLILANSGVDITDYSPTNLSSNNNLRILTQDLIGITEIENMNGQYGYWQVVPVLTQDATTGKNSILQFKTIVSIVKLNSLELTEYSALTTEEEKINYVADENVGEIISTSTVYVRRVYGVDDMTAAIEIQNLLSQYPLNVYCGIYNSSTSNYAVDFNAPYASKGVYLYGNPAEPEGLTNTFKVDNKVASGSDPNKSSMYIGLLCYKNTVTAIGSGSQANIQPMFTAVTGSGKLTLLNANVAEGIWAEGDVIVGNTQAQSVQTVINRVIKYRTVIAKNEDGSDKKDEDGNFVYEFISTNIQQNYAISAKTGGITITGTESLPVIINGDIIADYDIVLDNVIVNGNIVSSGGSVKVTNSTVSGSIITYSSNTNITLTDVTCAGSIIACQGAVCFEDGDTVVSGDVKAFESIKVIESDIRIAGDIETNGDMILTDAKIGYEVERNGNVTIPIIYSNSNQYISNTHIYVGRDLIIQGEVDEDGTISETVAPVYIGSANDGTLANRKYYNVYIGRNFNITGSSSSNHILYGNYCISSDSVVGKSNFTMPKNTSIYKLITDYIVTSGASSTVSAGNGVIEHLELHNSIGTNDNRFSFSGMTIGTLIVQNNLKENLDIAISNVYIDRIQANNIIIGDNVIMSANANSNRLNGLNRNTGFGTGGEKKMAVANTVERGYINAGVDNTSNIVIDGAGSVIYADMMGFDIEFKRGSVGKSSNAFCNGDFTIFSAANSGSVPPAINGSIGGWGPNIYVNYEYNFIDNQNYGRYGDINSLMEFETGDEYKTVSEINGIPAGSIVQGDFKYLGNVIVDCEITGNVMISGRVILRKPVCTNPDLRDSNGNFYSAIRASQGILGLYAGSTLVIERENLSIKSLGAAVNPVTIYAGGGIQVTTSNMTDDDLINNTGVAVTYAPGGAQHFVINGNVKIGSNRVSTLPLYGITITGNVEFSDVNSKLYARNIKIGGSLYSKGGVDLYGCSIYGTVVLDGSPNTVSSRIVGDDKLSAYNKYIGEKLGSSHGSSTTCLAHNAIYSKHDIYLENMVVNGNVTSETNISIKNTSTASSNAEHSAFSSGNITIEGTTSNSVKLRKAIANNVNIVSCVTISEEISATNGNITLGSASGTSQNIVLGTNVSVTETNPSINKMVASGSVIILDSASTITSYMGLQANTLVGAITKLTNFNGTTSINSNIRLTNGDLSITSTTKGNIQLDTGTLTISGTSTSNMVTVEGNIKVANLSVQYANIGVVVGNSTITDNGRNTLYVVNNVTKLLSSNIYSKFFVGNTIPLIEGANTSFYGSLYVAGISTVSTKNHVRFLNNTFFGGSLHINANASGASIYSGNGVDFDTDAYSNRMSIYITNNLIISGESWFHAKLYVGGNLNMLENCNAMARFQNSTYVGGNATIRGIRAIVNTPSENYLIVKGLTYAHGTSSSQLSMPDFLYTGSLNPAYVTFNNVNVAGSMQLNYQGVTFNGNINIGSDLTISAGITIPASSTKQTGITAQNITIGNNCIINKRLTARGNFIAGDNVTINKDAANGTGAMEGNTYQSNNAGGNILVLGYAELGKNFRLYGLSSIWVKGAYLIFDIGIRVSSVRVEGHLVAKFDYDLCYSDSSGYSYASNKQSGIWYSLYVGGKAIIIGDKPRANWRASAIGNDDAKYSTAMTIAGNLSTAVNIDSTFTKDGSTKTYRSYLEGKAQAFARNLTIQNAATDSSSLCKFRLSVKNLSRNDELYSVDYELVLLHMRLQIDMDVRGDAYIYNSRLDTKNYSQNNNKTSYYYFGTRNGVKNDVRLEYNSSVGFGYDSDGNRGTSDWYETARGTNKGKDGEGTQGITVEGNLTLYNHARIFNCWPYIFGYVHQGWASQILTDPWNSNPHGTGWYSQGWGCVYDWNNRWKDGSYCGRSCFVCGAVDAINNSNYNTFKDHGKNNSGWSNKNYGPSYMRETDYTRNASSNVFNGNHFASSADPNKTSASVVKNGNTQQIYYGSRHMFNIEVPQRINSGNQVVDYSPSDYDGRINAVDVATPPRPLLGIDALLSTTVNVPSVEYNAGSLSGYVAETPTSTIDIYQFKDPIKVNPELDKTASVDKIAENKLCVTSDGWLDAQIIKSKTNEATKTIILGVKKTSKNDSFQLMFDTQGRDMHVMIPIGYSLELQGRHTQLIVLGGGRLFLYFYPGSSFIADNCYEIGTIWENCSRGHLDAHQGDNKWQCTYSNVKYKWDSATGLFKTSTVYFVGLQGSAGMENNASNIKFINTRINAFFYFANSKNCTVEFRAEDPPTSLWEDFLGFFGKDSVPRSLNMLGGAVIANRILFSKSGSKNDNYEFHPRNACITNVNYGLVENKSPIKPQDEEYDDIMDNKWGISGIT